MWVGNSASGKNLVKKGLIYKIRAGSGANANHVRLYPSAAGTAGNRIVPLTSRFLALSFTSNNSIALQSCRRSEFLYLSSGLLTMRYAGP
jgi:hypothetical protein